MLSARLAAGAERVCRACVLHLVSVVPLVSCVLMCVCLCVRRSVCVHMVHMGVYGRGDAGGMPHSIEAI